MNIKLAKMILFLTFDKELNRTILNKLLFFSDVAYYLLNGDTISKEPYIKQPYGPVPQTIEQLRNYLIAENFLQEKIYSTKMVYEYGYSANKSVNKEKLSNSFNTNELECLKNVLENLSYKTASYLSNKSHDFEPWKSAEYWGDSLDFEKTKEDGLLKEWLKTNNLLENI